MILIGGEADLRPLISAGLRPSGQAAPPPTPEVVLDSEVQTEVIVHLSAFVFVVVSTHGLIHPQLCCCLE